MAALTVLLAISVGEVAHGQVASVTYLPAEIQMLESRLPQAAAGADVSLLREIYSWDSRFARVTLSSADASAWPVFLGTGPFLLALSWLADDDFAGADTRLGAGIIVSEVVAGGSTILLKTLIQRERPFRQISGITNRSKGGYYSGYDRYAMPSGHAALAWSIAASLAFSEADWLLKGPAFVWASAVSLSRPWLGVHFPSDILAGAVLGFAAAWLVDEL